MCTAKPGTDSKEGKWEDCYVAMNFNIEGQCNQCAHKLLGVLMAHREEIPWNEKQR